MNDFIKIVTVNNREVDRYLKDGWEIIDTTKEGYGDGGFFLKYHLGLSTRTMVMKLKEVIYSYEEHGFKEQLFKKVAESNGEDYSLYSNSISNGYISKDATISFMENYEKDIHDKKISYYKQGDKNAEMHF